MEMRRRGSRLALRTAMVRSTWRCFFCGTVNAGNIARCRTCRLERKDEDDGVEEAALGHPPDPVTE
jgi:hypothetical protein